ncbi:MAG: Txe/YoeB family addiction module toxin [Cyclobacteriaceae bacterium]
MRTVAFTSLAFKEYNEWFELDKSVIDRIKILIREIDSHPFKGIGKPEPLRANLSGYWSRRINEEHRLVYKMSESQILIVKCKGHY